MSDSIITLDVGGQIFRTQLSTLTKYPESMLATMFNHIDSGLSMFAILKSNCFFLQMALIKFITFILKQLLFIISR